MKPTTIIQTESSSMTLSDPIPREQLIDRLQDSLDALAQVQDLTREIGKFVIQAKVSEHQAIATALHHCSSLPATTTPSRKRKRSDEEENDYSATNTHRVTKKAARQMSPESLQSAKRMMSLFVHLQRTQALFQAEVEQFLDETEMANIDEEVRASNE